MTNHQCSLARRIFMIPPIPTCKEGPIAEIRLARLFNWVLFFLYILWVKSAYELYQSYFERGMASRSDMIMDAFIFAVLSGCCYYIRRQSRAEIDLYLDSFVIRRTRKERTIEYENIAKVSKCWFGVIVILKNSRRYRLSRNFQDLYLLLDMIKNRNPETITDDNYFLLRNKLVLYSTSFLRVSEFYLNPKGYLLNTGIFIFPLMSAVFVYWKNESNYIIQDKFSYIGEVFIYTFVVSFFLFYIIIFFVEIKILLRYRQKARQGHEFLQRDIHFERDVFRISLAVLAFFSFTAHGIILSFEPQVYRVLKVKSNKSDKIRKVKIDKRYNCGHCNYSLKIGDKIVVGGKDLEKNIVGEVVGIPGDTIYINQRNKKARYLSSMAEVIVTSKKIALQRKKGDRALTLLIFRRDIKGKILFSNQKKKKEKSK